MSEGEIFENAGNLGDSLRQDGRWYRNSTEFVDDGQLEDRFESLVADGLARPEEVGRVVFRGIVSDQVMRGVREGRLNQELEVAFPLDEFGHPGHLIYLARNSDERTAITPTDSMLAATQADQYEGSSYTPMERVQRLYQADGNVDMVLRPVFEEMLFELWGPIFGWSREQITNFGNAISSQQSLPPTERSMWFSGVRMDDRLVSAAEAERLALPGGNGPVDLVESTEWATADGWNRNNKRRHGYMAVALAVLHAQVLDDLRQNPNGMPVIFAECNFSSRSDIVARKTGMRIPNRDYANQLIIQNVRVGDGLEPEGLRDFTMNILPALGSLNEYSAENVRPILDDIRQEAQNADSIR